MTVDTIAHILAEAEALGTVEWIYFEGGEAFLYYEVLDAGIRLAKEAGFSVGIVTNAYWATSDSDAMDWLRPIADSVGDLSISSDGYHSGGPRVQYLRQRHGGRRRVGRIPTASGYRRY